MGGSTGDVISGAIGGAVAGFIYSGGNPYGAVAGAIIGAYAGKQYYTALHPDPVSRIEPNLQDKRINAGEFGSPIPIGFGTFKTQGVLIWGVDLIEESSTTTSGGGGKGSPPSPEISTTTHTALANVAFKLCKGPIVGISRLWFDNVLVLDFRPTAASVGASFFGASGTNPLVIRMGSREQYRLYLGTETQLPDTLMESYLGVGNVNAHRGDTYIVFDTLNLNSYGKRIPNVTAEIIVGGVYGPSKATLTSLDRFLLNPGATCDVTRSIPFYDLGNDRLVFRTRNITSGGNGIFGWQIESRTPSTGAQFYSVSQTESQGQVSGLYFHTYDDAANVLWIRDSGSLRIVNLTDGATRRLLSKTTYFYSYCAVAINLANDEVWITVNGAFDVLGRYKLLQDGTSYAAALKYTITIPSSWGPANGAVIWEARTFRWMIAQSNNRFIIYDRLGNIVKQEFSLAGSSAGSADNPLVDNVNSCFWCTHAPSGTRNLYRFDFIPLTDSLVLSNVGIAIALDSSRSAVIAYDVASKSLLWKDITGATIRTVDITTEVNIYGVPKEMVYSPTTDDVYVRFSEVVLIRYRGDRSTGATSTIANIITAVCSEVGVSSGDLNLSEISSDTVEGYAIDRRTQGRAAIDPLRKIAQFDLVNEDGKIKAKKFGGASVMTIDYTELIMPDDGSAKRPYISKRTDEIDIPSTIDVAYSDNALNYEVNTQSAFRHTTRSREKVIATLPVAISATTAKRAADVALYQAWASRVQWSFVASRKNWALNAGDAFTFSDEAGTSRRMLCVGREVLGMTQMKVDAIADDASVYSNASSGAVAGWTPSTITPLLQKQFELLDIPILRDTDDNLGYYVVADNTVSAVSAVLLESVDSGITYNTIGSMSEASLGYVTVAPGDFLGGNVWDMANTLTVKLYAGTLSSITDEQLLAGGNAAIVGNELMQYGTATLIGTLTYTLSRLLRGRRGTEWAIAGHSAGERFVPVSVTTQRITSSAVNALRLYKGVRIGAVASETTPHPFTNTQAGKKPFSPVYIRATRNGSLDVAITWLRRSRIGTAWGANVDIPLDDTIEKYEVDIMSGSVVKRTITVTSPTATYLVADQVTDFGSAQASVLVNIYQMSTVVGRGTPGIATV
jgi:hypothetical protein